MPGRTHWQGGDQAGRQAHKLEETLLRVPTKQDEKMLQVYFVETTHRLHMKLPKPSYSKTVRLRSPPVGFLEHTPPVGNLRLSYPTSDISAPKPR